MVFIGFDKNCRDGRILNIVRDGIRFFAENSTQSVAHTARI